MGRSFTASQAAEPIRPKWLIVGPHKVGKTTLAATWPRPYFITVSADQGKDTLPRGMTGYECDNWAEVDSHTEEVTKAIHSGRFPYDTLVFDGLSFMGDYAANAARKSMETAAAAKNRQVVQDDTRSMFRTVLMQLTSWAQRVQALPIHAIFTMHTTPIFTTDDRGVRTERGYQIDFPGSFKQDLERMVFGTIDMQPMLLQEGGQAIRSFLTKQEGRLSALRRDGRAEGTGYIVPPHMDNLTFPMLAATLTSVGVLVAHAPNLPAAPAVGRGDQPPAGNGGINHG